MRRIVFFLLCIWLLSQVQASVIDTIQTFSASMQKNIKSVVITPDNYSSAKELPVVHLLRGYSGNQKDWIKNVKGIEKAADQYNLIIVCPDGGFGSWYWDSPVDPASQYETYVSDELVKLIDSKYKPIKNPRVGR
jgi:S-formylglutathione hydrolase FrmB